MSGAVVVADDGAVRIIRMNRPEKKNALTQSMYVDMIKALREAEQSDAIRCVMFAGAPGVFCAGNDIADFVKASEGENIDSPALDFLKALARSQKPVVAAVGGIAVGVGTTMLLHCDYVVAADDAVLSTPFLRLGIIPEAASTLLAPMRMGHSRAFAFLVLGRPLTAVDARDAGLVTTVVDVAAVEETALTAAREIAALPSQAVAAARGLMRSNADEIVRRIDAEGRHLRRLFRSDEARAAFQAFFTRKK